jgi:WD40 repeat protein
LVYFEQYDILASGGTDRFISLYENTSQMRYNCNSKITKQGAGSVINKMCSIDGDKLIVGQSDEFIRLYQLSQLGGINQEDGPALLSSTPLATYKFEDSGINNLCSLNVSNLFISSGLNKSISVWDTR